MARPTPLVLFDWRRSGPTSMPLPAVTWAGRAVAVVLAVLFSASAFEKVALVRTHAARWHPLVLEWRWMRATAEPLFLASAVLDALVAGSLLLSEWFSAPLAVAAIAMYTAIGVRTPALFAGNRSCRCFGPILDARTRTQFLTRNFALIGAAVWLSIADAGRAFHTTRLIAALVLVATLAGGLHLLRAREGRFGKDRQSVGSS